MGGGGEGGRSQEQDHGQAIYAKIRYSVSSTLAIGCIVDQIWEDIFRHQYNGSQFY